MNVNIVYLIWQTIKNVIFDVVSLPLELVLEVGTESSKSESMEGFGSVKAGATPIYTTGEDNLCFHL